MRNLVVPPLKYCVFWSSIRRSLKLIGSSGFPCPTLENLTLTQVVSYVTKRAIATASR